MGKTLLGLILILPFFGNAWAHSLGEIFTYWPSLVLDNAGVPYVACRDDEGYTVLVKKFERGAWVSMGSPGASWKFSFLPSLALDAKGMPYVAFVGGMEGYNMFSMMRHEGGGWVSLGQPNRASLRTNGWTLAPYSLALNAEGEPLLAGISAAEITIMKFKGGTWEYGKPLGYTSKSIRTMAWPPSVAWSAAGVPFVAYMEPVNEKVYALSVKKYEKDAWVPVGSVEFPPQDGDIFPPSLALDKAGVPYVAFTDTTDLAYGSKLSVVKFEGGRKVYVGSPGFSHWRAVFPSLSLDKAGVPYVAYIGSAGRLSVMKFEKGAWVLLGQPGFSKRVAGFPTLALDAAGVPYVAYMGADENNGSKIELSVMKFEGGAWASLGRAANSAEPDPLAQVVRPRDFKRHDFTRVVGVAEQGNVAAQLFLGHEYSSNSSEVVAPNPAEAVKWYRKAAEQGNGEAQYFLGLMHLGDRGVPQNNAEAEKWIRKGAEQGYSLAQSRLGKMYAEGQCVAKDEAKAVYWLRLAAEQGDIDARKRLEKMGEKVVTPPDGKAKKQ